MALYFVALEFAIREQDREVRGIERVVGEAQLVPFEAVPEDFSNVPARSEKSEKFPARSFGNAAAAIMAALSVESAGVGKKTGQERPAARAAVRTARCGPR